jgi:UDP-N-acetyl-D-mannosaminuronic acid dehydrogenase
MAQEELQKKIKQREAKLAVIGLGYVGLPVACMFAQTGFDVLGVELKSERVEKINSGVSPIEGDEPGLAELLSQVIGQKKLRATSNYADLKDRDVILIDVETPVDDRHIPRYQALQSSIKSLGPVLKSGALVIVESTIAPGTIDNIVRPLLEKTSKGQCNEKFFLGNCPERVMPGKLLSNLRTLSRVVGGSTPETAETMIALYKHIIQADLDPVDCVTAELVKTVENAYRDTQIAFANEVALICEAVGSDVWKVRELVNKSPSRQMHLPGAGVGGHCIPKDPWLLAYGVKGKDVPLRIIPASRMVNDSMPLHIADLVSQALESKGKQLSDSRILVMGYAYLEDSDDIRNSPSAVLVNYLQTVGAEVVIHDPYVPEHQGDLLSKAKNCHAVVVMVSHSQYRKTDLNLLKGKLIMPIMIDGRGVFDGNLLQRTGWIYRGIGKAHRE